MEYHYHDENSKNHSKFADDLHKLKDRALRISQKIINKKSNIKTVISFTLSNEIYAIAIEDVECVCVAKSLCQIPFISAFPISLINIHGKIIGCVAIKSIFTEKAITEDEESIVVIVKHGSSTMGLIADKLLGVRELESVLDVKRDQYLNNTKYINNIYAEGIILLDIEKLLSDVSTKIKS